MREMEGLVGGAAEYHLAIVNTRLNMTFLCACPKKGIQFDGRLFSLNNMDGFKVPQNIPQDLLLIQEFISVPPTPNPLQEDDIDSSDSETVSEDEIAADLIADATDEDNLTKTVYVFSSSFLFVCFLFFCFC